MLRHGVLALAIVLAALSGAQVAQAQGVGRGGLVPMPPITHPGTHPPGDLRPTHHPIKRYPYWGYGGYAPSLFYAPYVSPEPTVVYQPIVVYSQPSEYAPSPSPSMELGLPPMPSVIPYPDGRYVLMGDGINSAYRWVWIPNPPSGPPEKSPPAVTPGVSRGGALYRWVDDQGVVHFTQGWDAVPERYRAQVKAAGAS